MPERLKKFIEDTGWAFASLAIAAIVQFILRVFLANYYGAGDLGLYTLAFSAYSFGLVFSGFGIDVGLVKYIAENKGGHRLSAILVTSGSFISLLSGFIIGLLLYLIAPYISDSFFKIPELTELFRIVSFSFPFIALEKATLGILNGSRRMGAFAFINITQSILVIILTLTFALKGLDIKYAVLSLIAPVALMSIISVFYVRSSFSKLSLSEHAPIIKMLLAFGFYVVLANSMGMILTYTDSILLGHFMTDVDVGNYAVAVILIQSIALPPLAVQRITGPMIANYWGKKEIHQIESLINRSMKFTAFYAVAIALLLGFLSRDLIILFFGVNFQPAISPARMLLLGAAFAAIQTSIGSALSSTAFVKIIFRLTGIIVILNIVLNILFIPHFGINGAAIATSISTMTSALIQLYFIQRLIKIRIDWPWFIRLFGFATLIAASVFGIGRIFNSYLCVFLAFVVLIITIPRFFISGEDRKQIKRIMHLPVRE